MSKLAPTLQAFFTDRLARQQRASPHTVAAYRDTPSAAAQLRLPAAPYPTFEARRWRHRCPTCRSLPRSPREREREQRSNQKRSTRGHPISVGYAPHEGDVVFQSLPPGKLASLIEGATKSPFSHCGIVALNRGRWVVIEAIGPVIETPLEQWIRRGRGGRVWAYRLRAGKREAIPAFIAAARTYLGRPYDTRYRMDDGRIYCSELVYKGYETACGECLGELVALRDLDWQPHVATIRELEGSDDVPLGRELITPRDLARASQLQPVFAPASRTE